MFHYRVCVLTVFLLFAVGAATTSQAELIASYGHENAANRLQDDTGNGHTLTNSGATFIASPAQPGFDYFKLGDTVASISGTQNLRVPDAVYPKVGGVGGSFTFTSLVNLNTTATGFRTILSSSRFRFQLANYNGRRLHFGLVTNPEANPITYSQYYTPLNEDVFDYATWYFVALSYDQPTNTLHGFLQDASDTWDPVSLKVTTVPTIFPAFSDLTLGRNISGAGGADNWAGMIDSARFYTTALSNAELEAVFFQFSVPEPSTVMLLLLGLCGLMLRRSRQEGS